MSGPSRGVHFAPSPVPSSPASSSLGDASIMSREDVSGALAFVNSQLISHGFSYGNGISTDGLADADATKLTKCLMGLLAQRTEDMKRVEDLGAKYRTLSYEHESLSTRLRDATDRAANAERETNVHKSRLATSQRSLQTTSLAHKHANAELTRVRTAAQALRATHVSEMRKRDKENERMLERWTKLSDSQLRISSQPAGMVINGPKCANAITADGGAYLAGAPGYLDVALEEAESSRRLLADENEVLRELLLRALNEGQQAVHELRVSADSKYEGEPPAALTLAKVFPLDSRDMASTHLSSLFNALQTCIAIFADPHRVPTDTDMAQASVPSIPRSTSPTPTDQALRDEAAQLRREVTTLTSELEHTQRHATAQTAQIKTLLEQIASVQHASSSSSESAVDKRNDEARKALEVLRDELKTERQELTRATLQLDRERAVMEKDRERFLQEKQALGEFQTPNDILSFPVPEPLEEFHLGPERVQEAPTPASPRRHRRPNVASPKKRPSPVKAASPAKANKKSKGRRASLLSGLGGLNLSPAKRGVAAPSFQTEVVIPPPPSTFAAALAGSTNKALDPISLPQSNGPLLSAFVLPPPSPMAKIPPRSQPLLPPATSKPIIPPLPTAAPPPIPSGSLLAVPETPGARTHATRISHAFSPAKPSPLSRILMMANSPDSPPLAAMPTLAEMKEEDEESSGPEISPTPAPIPITTRGGKKQPSLAAELGLPDSDSDSPDGDAPLRDHGKNKAQLPVPDKGKGKARAPALVSAATRHGGPSSRAGGMEKENVGRKVKSAAAAPAPVSKAMPVKKVASSKPPSTARVGAGLETAPKATLRRVVVAAPVPPAGKKPFV